ncbi:MAG: HPr family phosphocarrier protein [Candidatus Woesearchaeota archaeon]
MVFILLGELEDLDEIIQTYEKYSIIVNAEQGLHCRNAAEFVKTISKYPGEIYIGKKEEIVSARSIVGLLSLEAYKGTELIVYFQPGYQHEQMHAHLQDAVNKNYIEESCSPKFSLCDHLK